MSRQKMSPQERSIRSKINKLLYDQPVLRGNLSIRKITCGSKSCRCASGQTHDTLYLTFQRGKTHQVSIPHDLDKYVEQCVDNYRQILALLDELCNFSLEAIQSRKTTRSNTHVK